MASVNLTGTLTNPEGEPDEGAIVKFTLLTTTGNTVSSSKSQLDVPQDGLYDIDIVYGNLRVDYINEDGSTRFVAIVTVNGDTVATSLPELLNAAVPPTDAQLLEFQGILADAVTAQVAAEAAETGAVAAEATLLAEKLTTVQLIALSNSFAVDSVIDTLGYTSNGDGGGARWVKSGISGSTPSQSPAQLGGAVLSDGSGDVWAMLLSNDFEFDTFAELQASNIGNVYQKVVCRERAGATYVLQPSGYAALSGDATLANGLVAALQINGDILLDFFGDATGDCIELLEDAVSRGARFIKFESKVYSFSRKIVINRSSLALVGPDAQYAIFSFTNPVDGGIVFSPADPLQSVYLNGQGVSNVYITSTSRNDTDFALTVNKCTKFRGRDVAWNMFPNGLRNAGGQFNSYTGLIMESPTGTGLVSGSAGIRVEAALNTGGSYQQAYSVNFQDIFMSGGTNKITEDLIDIRNSDGCNFVNGYIGWAGRSMLKLETSTSQNIAALNFENFYFDGVFKSASGVPLGLYIVPSTGGGSISAHFGQGCFFGQYADKCISANSTDIYNLTFVGTQFSNAVNGIGNVSGDASESGVSFSGGCSFRNSTGGLGVSSLSTFTSVGNKFKNLTGSPALGMSGSINNLEYAANTFTGCTTNVSNTSSYNTTEPETNWYENVDYTPVLAFGGASVGITYSVQTGNYIRIGDLVTAVANLNLTSKGISTGSARVTLPITSRSPGQNTAVSVYATNMGAGINGGVQGNTEPGSSSHTLNKFASGTSTALTHSDFLNNSIIRATVSYRI
jgi:hypothetical protein